ncbi:MAG: hypothetical protein IAF38_12240 [Bacteroidia bacterium]|nr:hypothetical protein [Bacteroidia bacterium]
MKTVKGSKFCDQCQKNVYDMRRKSVDKIVALKKELGECCMIMYEDQLQKADQVFASEKIKSIVPKKHTAALPLAAGIAALSLLPQVFTAQNPQAAEITESKKTPGKIIPTENKITQYNGLIEASPKLLNKKHKLTVGFYDENEVFVLIKTFTTRSDGSFSFELSTDELAALKGKVAEFYSGKYIVYHDEFSFDTPDEAIVINVEKRDRFRLFRRRSVGGAYF